MPLTKNQKEEIKQCLSECFADKTCISTLASTVANLISERLEKLEKKVTELNNKLNDSQSTLSELQQKFDNLEQYSKVKQIRLYGIEESKREKLTEKVQQTLGTRLEIDNLDIDSCYRIGKTNTDKKKARPVIINFASLKSRNDAFYNKKKLKGSNMVLVEELTKNKYILLQHVKQKFGNKNAWSKNGKIYADIKGKKLMVKSAEELEGMD